MTYGHTFILYQFENAHRSVCSQIDTKFVSSNEDVPKISINILYCGIIKCDLIYDSRGNCYCLS